MLGKLEMVYEGEQQGPEVVAFYHLLDDLLQRPDVVAIPSGAVFDRSALGGTLLTFWLNRAFDRYVNEGADLDLELAEAQTFTAAYQQCAAGIPPYNPALDAFETYYQQFQDCAVRADPSMSDEDWVAKTTEAFFLRNVFNHSRSWPAKPSSSSASQPSSMMSSVGRPSSRSPMR